MPTNAYNSHGDLLLKKGVVVKSESQVAGLIELGLFTDASSSPDAGNYAARAREAPSVLHMMNLADKRLERLLFEMGSEPDFPARLMEVAATVISATELNSDIALACILLNQQAGDYPVRHCLDTAVIAILVAQSMSIAREKIVLLTATTPIVHALVGSSGAPWSIPVRRDTADEQFAIKESLRADQANIRFSMRQVWGDGPSF